MLVGEVLEVVGMLLEGGVVDQHVEPAEARDGLLDRLAAEAAVGDVAGDEHAAPALAPRPRARSPRRPLLVQIDDRDIGALARESTATARPMPESPPVISATFPQRVPLPG